VSKAISNRIAELMGKFRFIGCVRSGNWYHRLCKLPMLQQGWLAISCIILVGSRRSLLCITTRPSSSPPKSSAHWWPESLVKCRTKIANKILQIVLKNFEFFLEKIGKTIWNFFITVDLLSHCAQCGYISHTEWATRRRRSFF
jgi:hypothetical protein